MHFDVHEWLITRRDVQGAPFEWRMQIFVPWNCVLVHPKCHLQAGSEEGRIRCLENIRQYYVQPVIVNWLKDLSPYLTIAEEKIRWIKGK
jgi:hypothetical protein